MALVASSRSLAVGWSLLFGAVALAAAAGLGGLYTFGPLDKLMHLLVCFAAALLATLYLYGPTLVGARRALLLVAVVGLLGLGLGALWEIGEWGYDRLAGRDTVLGRGDTVGDLAVDLVGALLGGVVAVVMLRDDERRVALQSVVEERERVGAP